MNRRIVLLLGLMFLIVIPGVFAQSDLPEPEFVEITEFPLSGPVAAPVFGFFGFDPAMLELWNINPANGFESFDRSEDRFIPIAAYAASASSDAAPVIPQNIRNNKYYIESVRLTNLAQEAYEYGDYDTSVEYAAEALRYAQLSDEYVLLQLKIKEADDAIRAARTRINWASSVGAAERYPNEYGEAQTYFTAANTARSGEDWDEAIRLAGRVIDALAMVTEAPPVRLAEISALPAQYTVRPWNISKDCFWNIAGRPWAYGDSTKWRLIYNANRAKLPQPDNPDLIHPGMVLDIPSINGELRQGMWDAARTYTPIR
jgi:tetratricopeptide (TPR) repeat protein